MPQKLNKAGKMQDYIPKGNGDASGEYGTSNGTNKNFTTSDKKKETKANVITENKSVVVGNKEKARLSYVDDVLKKLPKDLDEDELEDAIKDELNDSVWYEDNNSKNISQKDFNKMVKEIKDKYKDNNKANIIDDDFSGNKKYDDSDIREMDDKDFGVGQSKSFWESITKEYESKKPILDKMGIDIADVKFTYNARTKDYVDNIDELVKSKGIKPTREQQDALDSLTDKVWQDRIARSNAKKSNKANIIS